jgi:acetyl-CoA acyltransferase 2
VIPDNIMLIEGARTPIGAFLGGLSRVSATALGAVAARGALERAGVDPAWIDAVYFGNVIQSSKDAAYLARHVGLDAGIPEHVPALTVNRACGSGLDALILGAKDLALGEARFVLAGGAENMSMTPYAMRGVREGWRMVKSQVDDMLFSALHDPKAGCAIGETVEYLAGVAGVSREAADAAAVEGQRRAAAALAAGIYAEEIVPVSAGSRRRPVTVERDEAPRPGTTAEALAALPGLYRPDGVVTAGNSCGLNDAGAALVMATAEAAAERGVVPLGRLVSWGAVGVAPKRMGLGPVGAIRLALERAGLSLAEIDVIEINDSFTVQALAVQAELGLDPARVNIHGGAIALGHPMGATGARLALSALYQLRRGGGRYAVAAVCVGGGQGVAAVIERA